MQNLNTVSVVNNFITIFIFFLQMVVIVTYIQDLAS